MRKLLLGALAALACSGCIVVHEHPRHRPAPPPPPPPPPPAPAVTVTYGWSHHRHVIWTEYYDCAPQDVYYLENSGYDDDDILVCLYIARHARVHPRYVFYEYDRCGRSLYAVSLYYRLPFGVWFYNGIPHGYACPPPYGRAYAYYWRGEPCYYSNAELHALVHLQIGVRYYGYSHVAYFDHHHRGYQRHDPHPFRTIVAQDHRKAGYGGKTAVGQPVVKKDRPWEHRDVKEWEKTREAERRQVQISHGPQKEREEQERVKREAEANDRRRASEEVRLRVEEMKKARVELDRRTPEPPRPPPPVAGTDRTREPDLGRPQVPGRAAPPGSEDRGAQKPPPDSRRIPEAPQRGPALGRPESEPPPATAPEPRRPDLPPLPQRPPETKRPETPAPPSRAPEPRRPELPVPPPRPPETKRPEAPAPPSRGPEPRRPELPAPPSRGPEPKTPPPKPPESQLPPPAPPKRESPPPKSGSESERGGPKKKG